MRAVATPGRWIWVLSGLITTAALVVSVTALITSAGQPDNAQPQSVATQTVTVPQPVTSLTVQSFGAPVEVTAGPVRQVRITETMTYDSPDGPVSVQAQPKGAPVPGGPVSAQPKGEQQMPGAPESALPAVVQWVSGGRLTLADPGCENSDCSVSFAVTVPADVTATVSTEGGPVTVSGVAGADLDSGGGPVSAVRIGGALTVITGGGPLMLDGLAGPLRADTAGGTLTAQDVAAATATVTTGGGDASMVFSAAPDTVTVSTDGGQARLVVPGGPYALNANSDEGGPQSVGIATDPAARRSITVISGGGPLVIEPTAGLLPTTGGLGEGGCLMGRQRRQTDAPMTRYALPQAASWRATRVEGVSEMRTRRVPGTGLLVTVVTLLAAGCSAGGSAAGTPGLEKPDLTVAVVPAVDSAGFFIAFEEGLFKAQGLNVTFKPAISSATVIDQQAAGKIDITGGNYVSYIQAQSNWDAGMRPGPSSPGVLAANLDIVAEGSRLQPGVLGLYTMPGSPITTLAQLGGRTVGNNARPRCSPRCSRAGPSPGRARPARPC
jgi:hypothetical protein